MVELACWAFKAQEIEITVQLYNDANQIFFAEVHENLYISQNFSLYIQESFVQFILSRKQETLLTKLSEFFSNIFFFLCLNEPGALHVGRVVAVRLRDPATRPGVGQLYLRQAEFNHKQKKLFNLDMNMFKKVIAFNKMG